MNFGGLGTRLGTLGAGLGTGGEAGPVPGTSATIFPGVQPAVQYHPNSQSPTLSGDRVTACPDLRALAAFSGLAAGGGTIGPKQMMDALGRKIWRFQGAQAGSVAATLTGISMRANGVFFVGRVHKHRATVNFANARYLSYTDDSNNTTATGAQALLQARVVSSGAPSINQLIGSDATNGWKVVPGCQLHMSGFVSRTTALGGQRGYMNLETAVNATQVSATTTGMSGLVIGGVPGASNAITADSYQFDLYEFAFFNQSLTNAEADAIAAAMVANWAIPALTRQIILLGDSITDAITTALPVSPDSAGNVGVMLCDPGAELVSTDCRVVNLGTSGHQISNLQTQKNAAQSIFGPVGTSGLYPGGPANNLAAIQIGRNDMGAVGNLSAAAHYANYVSLLNSATFGQEGLLQRGAKAVAVSNIATSNPTAQARIETFRDLIMDSGTRLVTAQFMADTLTGPGQTYDGLLSVLPVSEITVASDTKFKTVADAADTASGYYDSDGTHLVLAGQSLQATGGDTPQYGYGAVA